MVMMKEVVRVTGTLITTTISCKCLFTHREWAAGTYPTPTHSHLTTTHAVLGTRLTGGKTRAMGQGAGPAMLVLPAPPGFVIGLVLPGSTGDAWSTDWVGLVQAFLSKRVLSVGVAVRKCLKAVG